jgi:hypothetical protein
MSNNKQPTKEKYSISVGSAFIIGFFIGGVLGILILNAVIKGIL